jgi:hypothetical protein
MGKEVCKELRNDGRILFCNVHNSLNRPDQILERMTGGGDVRRLCIVTTVL